MNNQENKGLSKYLELKNMTIGGGIKKDNYEHLNLN